MVGQFAQRAHARLVALRPELNTLARELEILSHHTAELGDYYEAHHYLRYAAAVVQGVACPCDSCITGVVRTATARLPMRGHHRPGLRSALASAVEDAVTDTERDR